MKKKLKLYFQHTMDTCISCVNLMNPKVQRTVILEDGFNPEQLQTMNDLEVRIQTIRSLFIQSVIDNKLELCETGYEFNNTESGMYKFLKEWDEL
jgi:hypothetical protein